MIQALIFDCFGVLCVGLRDHALSLCPAAHRQELDDLFIRSDYGFISTQNFTQQAAELLGMSTEAFTAIAQRQYHRDERMVSLVRQLRATHATALLTNANDTIIRQLFTSEELTELFDEVVISSEVGMIKPQAELFALAAARVGQLAEACVLIDDVASNIRGAEAVGMQGLEFSDYAQCVTQLGEYGIYA